jgi:hypothetical protein
VVPTAPVATPETPPKKTPPRVIAITPPADLDAPPLPKPPLLRTTPMVPVVGLE